MKTILRNVRMWTLFAGLLGSSTVFGQFPEGFETAVPPAGWVVFDNGTGTVESWTTSSYSYSGSQAAYISYEAVGGGSAEDWLVSPQFTVSAGSPVLEFYQSQDFFSDFGSEYTVRVSTTSQTNMGSFTIVDTQYETDFTATYDVHYVDLSAYAGQSVYVAFVMTNDDGDSWYIDDVDMVVPPCVAPVNLAVNNITANGGDFSWTPFSGGTAFEAIAVSAGSPMPVSGTPVTGTTTPLGGLNQASQYDAYVREVCGMTEPLIISAIFDGPIPGGIPKGVELYVVEDIPDMSIYGISSVTNGAGPTGAPEFVFPAIPYTAGSYIYVTSDSAGFYTYFGVQTTYNIGSIMNINGNDAIELFKNGVVIDVYGEPSVNGTNTVWEYLDGWAYRNNGSLTNGGTFVSGDWTYSGINATDGEATNATAASYQPIGTFTTANNVSPWSMITFNTACGTPEGDSVQYAIEIPALPYQDTLNTSFCYTNTIGNSSEDVFYQYIANDACVESINVSLCGSTFDTYLRIYDAQMNQLDATDDDCGAQSEILDFPVTVNDTFYIVVEGYSSYTGEYYLDITANTLAPLAVLSQMDVVCGNDTDGSATVGTGDPSASYLWDANAGNQTGATAVDLGVGTYYVTATYPSGCVYTESVTIVAQNPAITANPAVSDVSCNGGTDGIAVLNEGGGTGTLTTDWGGEDPNALAAGTYTYTISDGAGCQLTDIVTVNEPAALLLSATSTDETTGNDGSIDLSVSGGTFPYSYSWTNGAGTNQDPSNLAGNTTYMVTVTDGNGCTDTLSVFVGSVVALNELADQMNLTVYPNPNSGLFVVALDVEATMIAYNAVGQQVAVQHMNSSENTVDFSSFEKGTYTLRFTTDAGSTTHVKVVLL